MFGLLTDDAQARAVVAEFSGMIERLSGAAIWLIDEMPRASLAGIIGRIAVYHLGWLIRETE